MQKELVQNITQKEAFLKYLQKMDIEMLELILNDSITYFGASKTVFLEKLSHIFNQVKLGGQIGDLRIKQHKTQTDKYYLLLQIFCYAIEFIIEEKDGAIIKIYGTKIVKSKEDIIMLSHLEIFFGDDEKVDFIPSNDYVMNLYKCTIAYQKLVNDKIQILSCQDISHWLKKHAFLYEEVKEHYMFFKYNDFRDQYFIFKILEEQLQSHNIVKMALNSFSDSTNTTTLLNWLDDYNRLYFCNVQGFEFSFTNIDLVNKTVQNRNPSNIYFKGDDFIAIIKFSELYNKYYDNFYR